MNTKSFLAKESNMDSVLDEVKKMQEQDAKAKESAQEQQPMPEAKTEPEPEKPVDSPVLPVNVEKDASGAVGEGLRQAMVEKVKEGAGKDIKGLAKDLTFVAGASDLQNDAEFKEKYKKELGEQLVQDLQAEGKRAAIVESAKKQQARNNRNQAFYDGCKPIFDLLGIEAAYGLVPMAITVVLLMIPFLLVSLVRFVVNSINSVFTAIAGFRKPAFWICSIIICIIITAAVILGALALVDALFGTSILGAAKEAVMK